MNNQAKSNSSVSSDKNTISISCKGKSITIQAESNLSVPDDKSTICIFCREKLTEETRCQRKNFKSVCKECFKEFFELMKVLKNSPNPDTDNLTPGQIHFAINLHNVLNLGTAEIKKGEEPDERSEE